MNKENKEKIRIKEILIRDLKENIRHFQKQINELKQKDEKQNQKSN